MSRKQPLYHTEVCDLWLISTELGGFRRTEHLSPSPCPRYVFHSAGILPDPSYHDRVDYLGQPGANNCSLRISDVRPSDSGTYVFYLITSHPTQKMPEQGGIQLLVAGGTFSFRPPTLQPYPACSATSFFSSNIKLNCNMTITVK